jgi:hypothetical protein
MDDRTRQVMVNGIGANQRMTKRGLIWPTCVESI